MFFDEGTVFGHICHYSVKIVHNRCGINICAPVEIVGVVESFPFEAVAEFTVKALRSFGIGLYNTADYGEKLRCGKSQEKIFVGMLT